ncbi:hypothetical protein EVAR_61823_1 [Eumeta japonica]|uniref:Uncharacterized protein n=1 Tax=Eumeta variegata TaxID=151549 RepID=A0A4C1YTD3_EUMVA|nr:hypothetical protein EVAR_61823_1 [Eumeta japonica]
MKLKCMSGSDVLGLAMGYKALLKHRRSDQRRLYAVDHNELSLSLPGRDTSACRLPHATALMLHQQGRKHVDFDINKKLTSNFESHSLLPLEVSALGRRARLSRLPAVECIRRCYILNLFSMKKFDEYIIRTAGAGAQPRKYARDLLMCVPAIERRSRSVGRTAPRLREPGPGRALAPYLLRCRFTE